MADNFLTLLDLTKRAGTDPAVGLVEEVNTVAPELAELGGRVINGITYKVRKRIALPAASGGVRIPAFRLVNEGSDIGSSEYEQLLGECFFLDGQMQIDEALVRNRAVEGDEFGDILADEASGIIQQKAIAIGDQFYRGTTADAKGFPGLLASYDSTNCEVSLGGASGSATSAWLVWNDPKGVHFVFGGGRGLEMGMPEPWPKQQVHDANGKPFMAYVNNLSGWIGLGFNHTRSAVRAKLITVAKPFTDATTAAMLAKMPIFMRRDKARLKLFMNSTAQLSLQLSRSTVYTANTSGGVLKTAEIPEESMGIPIILTDSILNNE